MSTLQPARGILLLPGGGISSDRALGLLAHTAGQLDEAIEHFEDALTFCRKAGYRPELAWTCHDYAESFLRPSTSSGRTDAVNRTKTGSLLDEALAISTDLGMRPLRERVVALQEKVNLVGVTRRVVPTYPNGLTQREVEVLRLIAAGKTDREIAEELFISVRTVGNHVSNILNKTNTSNRAEAATYAAHHGLA